MSTTDQLTGLIPTVVAAGIALKFTQAALGKQKGSKKVNKGKRESNKNSPW